jgi:peroxin-4
MVVYAQQLQAAKRLRKELGNLKQAADDDICLSCQDYLLRWKAWIRGPDETPYAGGVFELAITCSNEYPLAPPTIKFVTKVCCCMSCVIRCIQSIRYNGL